MEREIADLWQTPHPEHRIPAFLVGAVDALVGAVERSDEQRLTLLIEAAKSDAEFEAAGERAFAAAEAAGRIDGVNGAIDLLIARVEMALGAAEPIPAMNELRRERESLMRQAAQLQAARRRKEQAAEVAAVLGGALCAVALADVLEAQDHESLAHYWRRLVIDSQS